MNALFPPHVVRQYFIEAGWTINDRGIHGLEFIAPPETPGMPTVDDIMAPFVTDEVTQ